MRKEFPYDPYEGMVFYDPETEKTYVFARNKWVAITYEAITYDI